MEQLPTPKLTASRLAPVDLALARVLSRGGVTLSQLRRECRADVDELRAFLQAALLVGLLHWDKAAV